MGNAVSSGVNNDDLVNNLVEEKYITSELVEQVFRAVDRGHFVASERDSDGNTPASAYDDLAWREGNLHLSAPCIYTHVLENIDLKPGMSFLNLGSGTGYLSLMVGHIIGPLGCNHGVEIHSDNIEYAKERINAFIQTSKHFDKFNIGFPEFFQGNCLCLASDNFNRYDRVYCGAAVPRERIAFLRQFIKPGGILILPSDDQLLKVLVKEQGEYEIEVILPVSFASMVVPSEEETKSNSIHLPLKQVPTLKSLARGGIRKHIQSLVFPDGIVKVKAKPLTRSEKAKRSQMYMRDNFMRVRGRFRNRSEQGSTNQNPDARPNIVTDSDAASERGMAASEMERGQNAVDDTGTASNENGETVRLPGNNTGTPSSIENEETVRLAGNNAGSAFNENGETLSMPECSAVVSTGNSGIEGPSNERGSDSSVKPSKSEEKASPEEVSNSSVQGGDGESSNDSLDKNFKLISVDNRRTRSAVDNEEGTSSAGAINIASSKSTLACNTRDTSTDSQDGRPNEPKRIKMTSMNGPASQSEAPETSNVNEDEQSILNLDEDVSSNAAPSVNVLPAQGDESSIAETGTSASTYDLEIDEISDPENPVEFLHNEIVNAMRSTFLAEDASGSAPLPIRFMLDPDRFNLGATYEESGPAMASELSGDHDNDEGNDSDIEGESEVSCEDLNDYEESTPVSVVFPVDEAAPNNDTKLSTSNDSGFRTLSSTYSNEAQTSSPDEITCTRRKRKKGIKEAKAKNEDSGLWVRRRIEKLDLPQFLIDYLLFNRKG